MTTKDDFSDEEWARVLRAPLVAGLAVSVADPGGPIEAAKETMATLKAATDPPSHEQLLTEIALAVQAETQQHRNPLKGFKPDKGTDAGTAVVDELSVVRGLVAAKATPEETSAFATWLVAAAQAAADAAKDGGFLGFHAQQVSDREQAMIERVRAAVSE